MVQPLLTHMRFEMNVRKAIKRSSKNVECIIARLEMELNGKVEKNVARIKSTNNNIGS